MGNRFSYVPVSNVATPVIGGTPSRSVSTYWGGSIKWAAAKDIVNVKGRYLYSTEESITQEGINNSAAKILPRGTVVITARGTVGALAQLGENMAFNQTCYGLIAKETILSDFLYYALKGSLSEMHSLSYGTIFDTITIKTFDHLTIPLPSYSEQKAIASILGALDDKIELNRKMNETFEAMARAIFKSWFMDFDPIPGLGPHKEWQTSPLGKIPKGWRVANLGEVIELAYGKALKEDMRLPGKFPVYGSNGQVGWHNEKFVDGPGIVVGRKGNPGIVTWVPTDFYPIDTTFYVIPKGIIKSMYYFYHALRLQDLPSLGADSAVPGLNRNMAYMNKLIIPPEHIVDAFDNQVKSLADTVKHNDDQSRTLAAIRDALLPKLLSGEIRVKDAERFMEKET